MGAIVRIYQQQISDKLQSEFSPSFFNHSEIKTSYENIFDYFARTAEDNIIIFGQNYKKFSFQTYYS